MSYYTSNFELNQRISYLESEISKIAPTPVGGYNLENVLTIGNNAGTNDIDLNNQDLLNADIINTNNISNSSYKITADKLIYQELDADPSWNEVNGYYGLAKDTYPSLNPDSFGAEAVSTWNTRTSAVDNNWSGLAWSPELKLFVAVSATGAGDRVMTSPDGINWTSRTSPADYLWLDVVWSPELSLFVAVASSGTNTERAMYSSDGINWSLGVTPNDNYGWISICWSPQLGIFCAVASSGGTTQRAMTSPDGINWTIQNIGQTRTWNSICWSPELGLFCAVAPPGSGTGKVITSPDGINWTLRQSSNNNQWRFVCWSSQLGIFCAVSITGTNSRVMTSPDGINWTTRTSAADNTWRSIIWSPELSLFVAVSQSGTGNRIMTSPNGIDWTSRTSAADNSWSGLAWSPELGIFAVVSSTGSGNRVMTSNLAGRPPTSFNVFNSDFNSIDNDGFWTINVPYAQYINTGTQALPTTTATDITLNTTLVQSGITRSGNVISFNKAGVYNIGVSLIIEDSAGSADFYFSFTDNNGVVANSSSVMEIPSNKKTLGYAEIIYTATASSTIKVVGYTTSSSLSVTTYASPDPAIAVSPAIIMTIYKIK